MKCKGRYTVTFPQLTPRTGALLGDFPQTYSHVGLIHTARNLDRALRGRPLSDNLIATGRWKK